MDQLKQTQVCYPSPAKFRGELHKLQLTPTTELAQLNAAHPTLLHMRDGEAILYRRTRSLLYQCRFKLANGTWHRKTTGKASLKHAIARACDIYDEARYRQRR